MVFSIADHVQVKRLAWRVKRVIPLAIIDLIIVIAAYLSVYSIRTSSIPLSLEASGYFLYIVVCISLASLYWSGAYHRIWARTSGHDVAVIVKAVALSTPILLILDLVIQPRPFPLSVVLVSNMLTLMGFIAVRYRSRLISGLSWRWKAIWKYEFPEMETSVLIIGAGEAGQTTAWRLKHRFHGEKAATA